MGRDNERTFSLKRKLSGIFTKSQMDKDKLEQVVNDGQRVLSFQASQHWLTMEWALARLKSTAVKKLENPNISDEDKVKAISRLNSIKAIREDFEKIVKAGLQAKIILEEREKKK